VRVKMKILKFSADWCGPCKMLQKTLDDMVLPYPVESVDIDKQPELAGEFGIRGVPTMVLLTSEGSEQGRLVGGKSKADIMEWLS